LPIYTLTPINDHHDDWQISRFKDETVIRAPSEAAARWAATAAFKIRTAYIPGVPYRENPWRQEELVEVRVLDDAEIDAGGWPKEGQMEILEPAGHNGALEGQNWAWD
jgi:hypothetical protein